ncbi:MAG: methyltransferase [Dehalococcoidia bacterium]|nr:MAG: methyltransferase [Dehalococcoidia bacterium]
MIKGTNTKIPFFGNKILPLLNYHDEYAISPQKKNQDYKALANYFKELNTLLLSKKIEEKLRSLLISGILIALQNRAFKQGFKDHNTAQDLVDTLVDTITKQLQFSKPPVQKIANLNRAFSFMKTHTTLSSDKEFLELLISDIDDKINSFLRTYRYYDAIGQFYIEFLRYANNEKTLGIILTPPHITELFVELAGITKDSVVLDNCCGTSGFLISAMRKMDLETLGDLEEIKKIHNNRLIGIEFQDDVYALAVSNMIVHGDGKTNIFSGDCFEKVDEIKQKFKPTIGLLNPPYKPPDSGKDVKEELEFVLNNLEMLEPNGKCVAIVPMSCALAQSGSVFELKKQLLEKHTLEAIMSMPDQLFHDSDAGVVTCTMVFTAHVPHPIGKKTWFGYWKNDNFVKVKNRGRIDKFNKWDNTRDDWVNSFLNKEIRKGYSLMYGVTATDEWCAEAYMETDYSRLSESDFLKVIRDYVAYESFKR